MYPLRFSVFPFSDIRTNLCFAVICKFLGEFWQEMVFLKGLVKFREIKILKLEFEV